MSIIGRILRGEVDHIDRGADHLIALQEREAERERDAMRLRAQADQRAPGLLPAAARRLRLMK